MIALDQESRAGELAFGEDANDEGGGPNVIGLGPQLGIPDWEGAVQAAIGLGNDPGLGLLVDMAKRGEYDPWNLDIVALTDRYLEEMDERLDAQDLGRVARLIFYAAALIHLKAKALAEGQAALDYEDALAETLFDELGFDGPPGSRLRPDDLPLDYGFMDGMSRGEVGSNALMPRERPLRSRGLTLVDLILALREYDDRLQRRELEAAELPVFDEEMVLDECVGSSHQEDLDQDIIDVRHLLWSLLDPEIGVEQVELEDLRSERRTRAACYLALLFLAQDEEVVLSQEDFYGPVSVARGPHFGEVRAGVVHENEGQGVAEEDEEGWE